MNEIMRNLFNTYVVFIFWSGSEECEFLPLQCLLIIFKEGVGIPLYGSHLILEWGVGFSLPWGRWDVGVVAHEALLAYQILQPYLSAS